MIISKEGADIEITRRCVLKCRMCPVPISSNGREVPFDQIKNLVSSLELGRYVIRKDGKLLNLNISGGEPFLHSRILDILKLFSNAAKNVFIVSSLIGAKEEMFKLIRDLGNVSMQVSVLAYEKVLYKRIIGINAFNTFYENMEKAVSIIGEEKIYANVVVGRFNEGYIYDIIKMLANLGIINIRISPVIATNEEMKKILPKDYLRVLNNLSFEGLNLQIVIPTESIYKNSYYWYFKFDGKEWEVSESLFTAYVE